MSRLLDPRNGPDWDLPISGHPPLRTYVVASQPRSGSTLLCRLLWGTGRVGAPKEYLNPMQLRDWSVRIGGAVARRRNGAIRGTAVGVLAGRWGPAGRWTAARMQAHLAAVRRHRSSGGWFGLKLHHHHLVRWRRCAPVTQLLDDARWVRIVRQDRLAQAVSWELALQTGQWASWQPAARRTPRYSRRRIQRRIDALTRGARFWDRHLAGRAVLEVRHESLVADPEGETRRVLAWLGVPDAATTPVPAPGLARQAGPRNAEWTRRFRADSR